MSAAGAARVGRAVTGLARFAAVAVVAAVAGLAAVAGCATFEDPTIVLDLRVVAMTAEPPEQVLDVDLMAPSAGALIDQLEDTRVCAHVADPGAARALYWRMTACLLDDDEARCDPERPVVPLADSALGDPEALQFGGIACARIEYDLDPAAWIALVTDALQRDPTRGLGGVTFAVELRIGEDGGPPELDVFGVKQVRMSARIPDAKVANRNPTLTGLQLSRNNGPGQGANREHCANTIVGSEFRVSPGDVVTLFPVEPPTGVREEFIVPTLEGGFEKFTEVLSYQWLGGAGSFADSITGGPPDIFGNQTLLGTDWTAPAVNAELDVPIWVIQRDERLGVSVRETCIRVRP